MKNYRYTLIYMLAIVLVNSLFAYVPALTIHGEVIAPADILVGCVYVLRDMAQREIKRYVIIAMLLATTISYIMADQSVAFASASAFLVGEIIDWLIYSYTNKPLSQRLLWSSAISAPIDTMVFLYLIDQLNWLGFSLLNFSKFMGILLVWYLIINQRKKSERLRELA